MKIFTEPKKLQKWCRARKLAGKRIALVPTMGYLHEGHLSLIAKAKKKGADEIVVSVNTGTVTIRGIDLEVRLMHRDCLSVSGKITALEFSER